MTRPPEQRLLTEANADARYDDQQATASVFYVDSISGNDANSGKTWKKAKRTIQAAADAAPAGGEIVLSATAHDVGVGVTITDNGKCLTIRGDHPLRRRQHADQWSEQTHIHSTASTPPNFFFKVGTAASSNAYGWTFKQFYVDADTLADGGAAIETHGVNRAIVDDVAGRTLTSHNKYLIKSDEAAGDDASWWTVSNVVTNGFMLCDATNANYWTFPGTSVIGETTASRPAGPGVRLQGTQPTLTGLHVEGWQTGVKLEGARGAMGLGVMSEWTDTLVHMLNCYDSVVIANSRAGAGNSEVLDENGTNNTVIGARHRKAGTTVQSFGLSSYGVSPAQLAGDYISPIYGPNSGLPTAGAELPVAGPDTVDLFVSTSLTAEYWNGSAWVAWSTSTNPLHLSDATGITVDATHKRCRFTSGGLFDASGGLLLGRLEFASSGTGSTITVRAINTDTTVRMEKTLPYAATGNLRGFQATTPVGAATVQVEFNLDLTGGQTGTLRRLALYAPETHQHVPGKFMRSRVAPEGVISGNPGDIVQVIDRWNEPVSGLYRKLTGQSTTTGWGKAAFVPATKPVVSGARTGETAADTSLRAALVTLGLITDSTTA